MILSSEGMDERVSSFAAWPISSKAESGTVSEVAAAEGELRESTISNGSNASVRKSFCLI
jgi:hypothetical protein